MSDKIISLNIGGFKYCTSATTLTKYPNTFFSCLLSENIPSTRDQDGAFFIDRDGQFFGPILTWLRTQEISIPVAMNKNDVLREAKFYSLQPLVDELMVDSESQESCNPLNCPKELEDFVDEYWGRHRNTILSLLGELNKDGALNVTLQIFPGHRQDIERSPQLLAGGKIGLYMNFTGLHVAKYARVQHLLSIKLKEVGFGGFFRPGDQISLWWIPNDAKRESDIIFF